MNCTCGRVLDSCQDFCDCGKETPIYESEDGRIKNKFEVDSDLLYEQWRDAQIDME